MAVEQDSMVATPVEQLLESTGSKFKLVTLSAMRAREINAYFGQLGEGLGRAVPPQVTSIARKPLSISFEEIASGKIVGVAPPEPEPAPKATKASKAKAAEAAEAEADAD